MKPSTTAIKTSAAFVRFLTCCLLSGVLILISGSSVRADEIVCITCHSAMPGKYGEPVKLWKGSIHA